MELWGRRDGTAAPRLVGVERRRNRELGMARQFEERQSSSRLSDKVMIETAARLVHAKGNDAELLRSSLVMEWGLGSGAAHGRLLMGVHRVDGFRNEVGDTALLGASHVQVAMQICGVSLILNEGWRQWDLRRRA